MNTLPASTNWIDVHTHRKTSIADVFFIRNGFIPKSAAQFPYAVSYGLHPWFVTADWKENVARLETHFQTHRPLIIGECGLDRLRGGDFRQQQEAFEQHLHLAKTGRVPVLIHQVRALEEILQFKKKFPEVHFILHGFRSSAANVKRCLDHRISFSIGGYALSNSVNVQEMLQAIPANRLFLETDTLPIGIQEIYAAVARLRKITLDELRTQTLRNFEQLILQA
jgi:TatD DNase family protein